MSCEAQFTVKDQNGPSGEDDPDNLPGYTIGWSDIGKYIDYNGTEKLGYILDKTANTMAITKCHNKFNSVLSIPSTMTLEGTEYLIKSITGFSENPKLNLIYLPDTLIELQGKALNLCNNLYEIKIPASVTYIADAALSECKKLQKIVVAEGNSTFEVVDNCLINKQNNKLLQGLTNGIIPNTITELGTYCFASMPITSIEIPESITKIPANAFSNCSELLSVKLPDTLTALEATCFAWCYKLSSLSALPEGLTDIKTYAFDSCALEAVDIPSSVSRILNNAFGNMSSLEKVEFKGGVSYLPTIDYNAFINSGPIEFSVPWTKEQHNKFVGTYTTADNNTYNKDIFFGAKIGSKIIFSDGSALEKTEEVVPNV
jgi:hypothetical protein